jgi:hypothetical protein
LCETHIELSTDLGAVRDSKEILQVK